MESSFDRNRSTVTVDDRGVVARFAEWQARGKGVAVGAMTTPGVAPTLFVENEVLVDAEDRSLVDELIGLGGRAVPPRPLLPPPHGVSVREEALEFPSPVCVRFSEPPRVDGAADVVARAARQRDLPIGALTISSERAARVAALVARYAAEGRDIGLNALGSSEALPLASATEGGNHPAGSDPFAWDAFAGRSRVVHAWQLVESVRAIRGLKPVVWIAILDGGFWLDAAGVPLGQPSDFGAGVLQINLIDESANASGTNPNKCKVGDCPWHGNQVASVAVAAVGNGAGAAGVGGTVARPVFFRSRLSESQVYRCLQYCTAWGLDVLNMSFAMKRSEFFFSTGTWDKAFNFAVAHGVVPVAGAGNGDSDRVGQQLPDYNVRPATRTPGVITVGALDGDNAAPYSNYGSSVTVWAPGTAPVGPDGGAPNGGFAAGTSIAAPIVSGVAAMMRAVNPQLDALTIRRILSDTGWQGSGRVNRGLDAHAAVFAAIGGRLTDLHEPNDTSASAVPLATQAPGLLGPTFGGFAARSGAGDDDWWRFTVQAYSDVTISCESYPLLGGSLLELHPDDPLSVVAQELEVTRAPGLITWRGLFPPGTYRLRVAGNRPSLYQLLVRLKPASFSADRFETNDSFDTAARFIFEPRSTFHVGLREWGPGVYRATLHRRLELITSLTRMDVDYFRLEVPPQRPLGHAVVKVFDVDLPVTVRLFDDARALIREWTRTRGPLEIKPPTGQAAYLEVSGEAPTRYRISVGMEVDPEMIPGPHQKPFEVFPPWWLGEPLRLVDRVTNYYLELGADPALGKQIAFQPGREAVTIDLVDGGGSVVRAADVAGDGRLSLDTTGLARGAYLVRVSRAGATAGDRPRLNPLELRLSAPL